VFFNREMGALWKSPNRWIKVPYSFFHADRSRTPTPLISGERDFNAPIAGSEQMYRVVKFLGVGAHQLVIYRGQYHCIKLPC
jgi:dipeptidyl aminopeptidase/acylaminoacyl peptidase